MGMLLNWLVVVPVAAIAFYLFRLLATGSLTAALLGGRIERLIGEVDFGNGALTSVRLRVYKMKRSSGEEFIGLALVTRGIGGVRLMPYRLTLEQARDLAHLLNKAQEPADGLSRERAPAGSRASKTSLRS